METKVKERPILFSGAMVRAILGGRKTQTRRIIKPQPVHRAIRSSDDGLWYDADCINPGKLLRCPYGQPGDRLWVKETHYLLGHWQAVPGVKTKTGRRQWRFVADSDDVLFDPPESFRKGRHHADPETVAWHKRLGRFMPRRFSRLALEVTDRRAERVQDISWQDAVAEGIEAELGCPREQANWLFRKPWNDVHGEGAWDRNDWVWVVTFKRVLA